MRKGILLLTMSLLVFVPSLSANTSTGFASLAWVYTPPSAIVELQAVPPTVATLHPKPPNPVTTPHANPPVSTAASQTGNPSVHATEPLWLEQGRFIDLRRKSSPTLLAGDKMKFVATLINTTNARWNLVAELVVRKSDGSQETLISHYKLHLNRDKQLRVPMAMSAKPRRFPPGLTQFVAFLRDPAGQIVDRASITFVVRLPLP